VATLLGLRRQGWRWVPRFLWTMAIASTYTFVLFQVSHYQLETLDGAAPMSEHTGPLGVRWNGPAAGTPPC
jgi:hypothetical protein